MVLASLGRKVGGSERGAVIVVRESVDKRQKRRKGSQDQDRGIFDLRFDGAFSSDSGHHNLLHDVCVSALTRARDISPTNALCPSSVVLDSHPVSSRLLRSLVSLPSSPPASSPTSLSGVVLVSVLSSFSVPVVSPPSFTSLRVVVSHLTL